MKRIEEICRELSEEEREEHKELIKECIDREKEIINSSTFKKENFERFFELFSEIGKNLDTLKNTCSSITQIVNSTTKQKDHPEEKELIKDRIVH
jgi:signal recognition particle GTPase